MSPLTLGKTMWRPVVPEVKRIIMEIEEKPMETNQTHITLYTLIGNFERIQDALTAHFADMTEIVTDNGDGGFTIRLKDGSDIVISVATDREFMNNHLVGMHNFFAQAACENEKLREGVLRQILAFNCMASGGFGLDDNEDHTNYIVNTMFAAAKDINALVLMPDMRLFSAEGKLVYSAEGESDLEDYIPIGNADYIDSRAEEKPVDAARRSRSIAALEEKGVPYFPRLPVAMPESEAQLRTPEETARRLLAMFGVCVYSEVRGGDESWDGAQKYLNKINDILGGGLDGALTLEEKRYLAEKEPEQRAIAKFSWRYECCHVLMWALGFFEELGYPDRICDVSRIAKPIWSLDGFAGFLENAKPRSREEILDAADMVLLYDWACVDARVKGNESPANMNGEVVVEWHHALNWLVGTGGSAPWDDVQVDT